MSGRGALNEIMRKLLPEQSQKWYWEAAAVTRGSGFVQNRDYKFEFKLGDLRLKAEDQVVVRYEDACIVFEEFNNPGWPHDGLGFSKGRILWK